MGAKDLSADNDDDAVDGDVEAVDGDVDGENVDGDVDGEDVDGVVDGEDVDGDVEDDDDDGKRRAGAKELSGGRQSNHHCLRSQHLSKYQVATTLFRKAVEY